MSVIPVRKKISISTKKKRGNFLFKNEGTENNSKDIMRIIIGGHLA